jgi:predicted ATPase
MDYSNGSEWRRWDLHMHTPHTKKADAFAGNTEEEKWANYVEAINLYPHEITAVGITDYFSIDGYFRFLEEQKAGNITKNIPLVIPNVELRVHPVAKDGQGLNLHVLFDPEIADQIQGRFLDKLKFSTPDRDYTANPNQLRELGRALRPSDHLNEAAALRAGIEGYLVSIDCVRDLFKQDKALRKDCIIVIANGNDGASGLRNRIDLKNKDNTSQVDPLLDTILQFSDAIFSSSSGDREFYLGEKSVSPEEIVRRYHSLMPCYHGCDAHSLEKVFEPDKQRYCWIKADPTFNGLRQTLHEPALRVHIGPTKPVGKIPYQVIDYVVTGDATFANAQVPLHPDLTCLIGGRSTGKSLFLAMMAKKLQPSNPIKPNNPFYDQFVATTAEESRVVWADGQENDEREIEYFYQGYMETYSRDPRAFDKLVQKIITVDLTDDPIAAFDAFVASNRSAILEKLTELEQLRKEAVGKATEQKSIGDIEGIKAETTRLVARRDQVRTEQKISEEEFDAFTKLSERRKAIAVHSEALTRETTRLDALPSPVLRKPDILNLLEPSRIALAKALAEGEVQAIAIWVEAIKELREKIQKELAQITAEEKAITENPLYIKGTEAIEKSTELKELDAAVNVQTEKKLKFDRITTSLAEMADQESQLRKDIITLKKRYYTEAERLSESLNTTIGDGDLTIRARPQVVLDDYNNSLSDAINLQSHDHQNEAFFDHSNNTRKEYFEEVEAKMARVLRDGFKFKNNFTAFKFLRKIIGECYVRISYSVTYDGDEYARMSEGKQAFVVLRLLLDFSNKTCPILIDQPEDDLDNRAIYTDLVKYLRTKKAERQIILVTHNPNIVVGTDAELVVVANQHGIRTPNEGGVKFQYLSGSIENSAVKDQSVTVELESQGIREHICEVLEGGAEAFKARERRYRIVG